MEDEKQTKNSEEKKPFQSSRINTWEEKLNSLDRDRRSRLFKYGVGIVILFLMAKFVVSIACTSMRNNRIEQEISDTQVITEDSIERLANKILDKEFLPTHHPDSDAEKAMDELVREDREQAEKARKEKR